MRNDILLFVNGQQHRINGTDAFLTLSDFLRRRLKLCGTKIVCSEGDCGSCSVLCGRADTSQNAIEYLPIDSCIRFVFQLDGCHIVTVEGLAGPPNPAQVDCQLNGVQQAMIDCHGSQCGFCTPGFVVAMTGILEQNQRPDESDWRHGLTGNLCRCTGYSPILTAGEKCQGGNARPLNEIYSAAPLLNIIQPLRNDDILIESQTHASTTQSIYAPTTIAQAVEFLAQHPIAKVVAGATDVGVQFNKGLAGSISEQARFDWVDLNRVDELTGVEIVDGIIVAGARATWTDIETLAKEHVPQFYDIVSVFGSPQIRHVGTIGGNIINASPIADSLPFLFVSEAKLELTSKSGRRLVNVNDFYSGYKQLDLQPGELLTRIMIPLPAADSELRLFKISRRRDLDISSFTAAIRIKHDGDIITDAAIAYGAVGPTVIRLRKTESFLAGQPWSLATMQSAGDIAIKEITPITDVRGGKNYRLQLAKNVLLKFFHQSSVPVA